MSRILEAFGSTPPGEDTKLPGTYSAVIVDDATDLNSLIRVIVPEYDDRLAWGPMPWPSRIQGDGSTLLPSAGDAAMVTITEDGQIVITSWQPAAGTYEPTDHGVRVFMQITEPSEAPPWIWVELNPDLTIKSVWKNTP